MVNVHRLHEGWFKAIYLIFIFIICFNICHITYIHLSKIHFELCIRNSQNAWCKFWYQIGKISVSKPVCCPVVLWGPYCIKIIFSCLFMLHPSCHHGTWNSEWELDAYIHSWVNRYFYIQVWYKPLAVLIYSEVFSTVSHFSMELEPDVSETVSACIIRVWCDEHYICPFVYTKAGTNKSSVYKYCHVYWVVCDLQIVLDWWLDLLHT
jgi:hypothetical protein